MILQTIPWYVLHDCTLTVTIDLTRTISNAMDCIRWFKTEPLMCPTYSEKNASCCRSWITHLSLFAAQAHSRTCSTAFTLSATGAEVRKDTEHLVASGAGTTEGSLDQRAGPLLMLTALPPGLALSQGESAWSHHGGVEATVHVLQRQTCRNHDYWLTRGQHTENTLKTWLHGVRLCWLFRLRQLAEFLICIYFVPLIISTHFLQPHLFICVFLNYYFLWSTGSRPFVHSFSKSLYCMIRTTNKQLMRT